MRNNLLLIAALSTLSLSLSLPVAAATRAGQDEPFATTQAADNEELATMYEVDQNSRQGEIDWSIVAAEDRKRETRVYEMIEAGDIVTANDHFHAAMILQHGTDPADYDKAHELSKRAYEMDPELKVAGWLSAATKDRYLLSIGEPQWYGTQFGGNHGVIVMREVDESKVTDQQRQALGVPTLEQSRTERVDMFNKRREVDPADNEELEQAFVTFITEMFTPARKPGEDWELSDVAKQQIKLAEQLMKRSMLETKGDYAKAATILHYASSEPEDFQREIDLLEKAREIDPADKELRRSYAQAVDKKRLAEGKGQWYGTSLTNPAATESGQWEFNLDPESTVTDEERAEMGLMPLEFWEGEVAKRNAELTD